MERQLERLVAPRLEATEQIRVWSRAWVSRWGRLNVVFAARTRDFAVVTDRRLMLWSTGFFTRRPRRRVLAERLDDLTFDAVGRLAGRRIRCTKPGRRPLLLEVGTGGRGATLAAALLGRDRPGLGEETDTATAPDAVAPVVPPAPDAAPGEAGGACSGDVDPASTAPAATRAAPTPVEDAVPGLADLAHLPEPSPGPGGRDRDDAWRNEADDR